MPNLTRLECIQLVRELLSDRIYKQYDGTKESHEALVGGLADTLATIFLGALPIVGADKSGALECLELSEKILAEMRKYVNDKEYGDCR